MSKPPKSPPSPTKPADDGWDRARVTYDADEDADELAKLAAQLATVSKPKRQSRKIGRTTTAAWRQFGAFMQRKYPEFKFRPGHKLAQQVINDGVEHHSADVEALDAGGAFGEMMDAFTEGQTKAGSLPTRKAAKNSGKLR